MLRVASATLILLALVTGGSTQFKRFLRFTYTEINKCPESARTPAGSEFALRTPNGQGCVPIYENRDEFLKKARFVDNKPVVFLIHNSDSDAWDAWVQASQYRLSKSRGYLCNVFAFNWRTAGSVDGRFTGHAANAKAAAADLAAFIRQLIEHGKARQEDIHLVGFGRGAHLAGFAGKKLEEGTPSILIGRITGLDPTGSGFEDAIAAERLNSTDAKLVVVIHTNAYDRDERDRLKKPVKTIGIPKRIGHVDFYPNGGMLQPGCSPITQASHRKATEFFYVSLDQTIIRLYGLPCSTYRMFKSGGCGVCEGECFQMGYLFKVAWGQIPYNPYLPYEMNGRYFLKTPSEPFFNTQPWLIQLNVTSEWPGDFAAKLRTTDSERQVKKFVLTEQNPVNEPVSIIVHLSREEIVELKVKTKLAKLTSAKIKMTHLLQPDSKYYGVTAPTVGQYVQLNKTNV